MSAIDRNSAQWHTIIGLLADMVEAGRADLVDSHRSSCHHDTTENTTGETLPLS